ncbi:MAG: type II secretion system F family protein [Rhizomicrobium sp.]
MATYKYRAATATGQLRTGMLEGSSRADAVERVKRLGLMPIETVETSSKVSAEPKLRLNSQTRRGIVNAVSELAVLLNAGLPLDRALGVCVENLTRPAVKATFAKLREPRAPRRVARARDAGKRRRVLANGVGDGPKPARPAASSTKVSDVLAETMERAETLRQTIVSSMVYPIMLIVIATSVILVMLLFVVPQFESLFKDTGAKLPFMTQVVMAASHAVQNYGIVGAILGMVGVFLLVRWARQPAVKRVLDRQILNMPVMALSYATPKRRGLRAHWAAFSTAACRWPPALAIAQRSIANMHMAEAVDKVSSGLRQGGGLSSPLAATGLFPPMALSFLRTGEETAQLGLMLSRLADVLDREVRNSIQRIIAVLTPAITVAMGAIVATVIASIMSCNSGLQRSSDRTMTMCNFRRRHTENGFTLLELLVVLAIMGMLAAIIAPQVIGYLGKSRTNDCAGADPIRHARARIVPRRCRPLPNATGRS